MLRVATWNTAGGHRSAQAPVGYGEKDQRAALMEELRRWGKVYGCDVIALQECESSEPYTELLARYELAGVAEAPETRGWVHVYVRRGLSYTRVAQGAVPCVALRIDAAVGDA